MSSADNGDGYIQDRDIEAAAKLSGVPEQEVGGGQGVPDAKSSKTDPHAPCNEIVDGDGVGQRDGPGEEKTGTGHRNGEQNLVGDPAIAWESSGTESAEEQQEESAWIPENTNTCNTTPPPLERSSSVEDSFL